MARTYCFHRFFRRSDNDSGSIAVELGMIAPVVLIMLLGVVEVASAINQNLAVQALARAGTDFGLTKPPVQGDVSSVISAVKAAIPAEWASDGSLPNVNANLICECEVTGPVACGGQCGQNERMQTYLKVDVSRTYTPIVSFRFFSRSFKFSNTSQVRLN